MASSAAFGTLPVTLIGHLLHLLSDEQPHPGLSLNLPIAHSDPKTREEVRQRMEERDRLQAEAEELRPDRLIMSTATYITMATPAYLFH